MRISLRQLYRRLRLMVKSYLYLPSTLRILANDKTAFLSSRGFPTANVALWLGTKDVLDYEPEERALLEPLLKDTKCFWDIGAQIGFYAILAALHEVPQVYAFDIDERYCEEIQKHAMKNNLDIKVMNTATGLPGRSVTFANYGCISTRTARSLDQLTTWCGVPDLIKMDIDGGEVNTLTNVKLLSDYAPKLVIEFLERQDEITSILEQYGYHLESRVGNNTLWTK